MLRFAAFVTAISIMMSFGPLSSAHADGKADFAAGSKALEEDRYDLAIHFLTSAIRSGELRGDDLVNALFRRSLAYRDTKEYEKALADADSMMAARPSEPLGRYLQATLLATLKRYDKAREPLVASLDGLGKDFWTKYKGDARRLKTALFQVVRADQMAGRWSQAEPVLQRFSKIEPEDNPIMLLRSRNAAGMGRSVEAMELLRKLDNQFSFVVARADKGFATLWNDSIFIQITDVPALYERELKGARDEAKKKPDELDPILNLMMALRRLGRPKETIKLGEQTLASDLKRFKDRERMEVWIYDEIARAAKASGDLSRAERAYRQGIEQVGEKNPNIVNILINAGEFLVEEAGKYRDALDLANRAEKVGASAYGLLNIHYIRVVSAWGLKQRSEVDRLAAEIARRAEDNPSTAIDLYLLLGQRSEAARLVIAQLQDPQRVDPIILDLQRYAKARKRPGAAAKIIDDGWNALRRDPTVLAAVEKIGRIIEVPAASAY